MPNGWTKTERNTCKFCNKSFTVAFMQRHLAACKHHPNRIKLCVVCDNPTRGGDTCSRACANTHFRSGPNHPNWNEDFYRTTCFHYHKMECVVCQEQNIVEVHHYDEDHSNNAPENLIPLCPTHHQYWHSRFKHLVKDAIDDYVGRFQCLPAKTLME